jgi:uncharacterized protein YdeI (YjbR/CyaY-like superfamily)
MGAVPDDLPVILFASAAEFEAWLEEEHAGSAGVWLKIAKKGSGVSSVSYAEAVELALCFGWIDGQIKALDERHYLQRFTPRRPRSKWSRINRDRVEALTATGRMRPSGLAAVVAAKADGRWQAAYQPPSTAEVPRELRGARRRQSLRDHLPPERREEAGDTRAAPEEVRRDAEGGGADPSLSRARAAPRRKSDVRSVARGGIVG